MIAASMAMDIIVRHAVVAVDRGVDRHAVQRLADNAIGEFALIAISYETEDEIAQELREAVGLFVDNMRALIGLVRS